MTDKRRMASVDSLPDGGVTVDAALRRKVAERAEEERAKHAVVSEHPHPRLEEMLATWRALPVGHRRLVYDGLEAFFNAAISRGSREGTEGIAAAMDVLVFAADNGVFPERKR